MLLAAAVILVGQMYHGSSIGENKPYRFVVEGVKRSLGYSLLDRVVAFAAVIVGEALWVEGV